MTAVRGLERPLTALESESNVTYHYSKELKSRLPVDADHPVIKAAIRVLKTRGGGPLTSKQIFDEAVCRDLLGDGQYNTLRGRLSQHCDLTDARVLRVTGTKIGVRGSRGRGWVLRETGKGIQQVETPRATKTGDPLLVRRRVSDTKRRVRARQRARQARNLLLTDDVLQGAPESVWGVAGRTVREALLRPELDEEAVRWILTHLPLERRFRDRLLEVVGSFEERVIVIHAEETRKRA